MQPGKTMQETVREDGNGFDVAQYMALSEWLKVETDRTGGFIHLVHDDEEKRLYCYLSDPNTEAGEGGRFRTVVENVYLSEHFLDDEGTINHFYLTGMQAETFRTFLRSVSRLVENHRLNISWWEDSGMKMMENERTNVETLNLRVNDRQAQITSCWQTPLHKMAKLESEKL